MRKKKLLKVLGLSILIGAILVVLFVGAFIFNPFEGSLRDVRGLVPRSSHFFLRKTNLRGDLVDFPRPLFWADLADTEAFRRLQQGPLIRGLRRQGVERQIQQLEDLVDRVRSESSGYLDLMEDVLGREVIIAGRFADFDDKQLAKPWVCLFARVSWKIRFAWGLAHWGIVQDQFANAGITVREEDDYLVFETPEGFFYCKRVLDCVMVCNSKEYLDRVQEILDGVEGLQPLVDAAEYQEAVETRLPQWARQVDAEEVNAIEFSVRPNELPAYRSFAREWPDKNHPDSMNERVLASFIRLSGWNFVNGALAFLPGRLDVLAQVKLDSNDHTPFQNRFFRAEERPRSRWLDPFLRMVPADACAAAALRMPARDFLEEMYLAMEENERALLDEAFRSTGEDGFSSVRELIDRLEFTFQPRTGFIFRRNVPEKYDPSLSGTPPPTVTVPSAAPQIAWVFWVAEGMEKPLVDMLKILENYRGTFGFTSVVKLDLGLGGGGATFKNTVTEFYNPRVPGTGEVAVILFDRFFLLSNSGPLIRSTIRTYFGERGNRSVLSLDEFRSAEREMPDSLNGYLYINGRNTLRVLEGYQEFMADEAAAFPNPDFLRDNRSRAEADVLRQKFSNYRSVAGLPDNERAAFEQAVRVHLQALWAEGRSQFNARDRAALNQLHSFMSMVRAVHVYAKLQPTLIDLTGQIQFDY